MPTPSPRLRRRMAPAPGKQRSGYDKAETEQQRVAIDAAATKLPSEEVYPERFVDDVRQHRPDRHQAIVSRIYCVARSLSGGGAALRMDQQPLAGPGRSAAENHVREREHAVILVPLRSVVVATLTRFTALGHCRLREILQRAPIAFYELVAGVVFLRLACAPLAALVLSPRRVWRRSSLTVCHESPARNDGTAND